MAIVKEMPSEAIISGFKGHIDFYYWKDIAVCRRWPKKPSALRNENVRAQWPAFSYIAAAWSLLTPELQRLYNVQATGTVLTGRDLFTRSYLSGWRSLD